MLTCAHTADLFSRLRTYSLVWVCGDDDDEDEEEDDGPVPVPAPVPVPSPGPVVLSRRRLLGDVWFLADDEDGMTVVGSSPLPLPLPSLELEVEVWKVLVARAAKPMLIGAMSSML